MTRLSASSVLVFAALVSLSLGARGREIYLACSLVGPGSKAYQYSFAFEQEYATLFWIEGTQKFKVIRNTSTQLWGTHEMKFRDFPHDATDFRLNRVTGAAEMNYLRKPSTTDVASCKKDRSWGCEDFLVLPEKSESGTCTVVDRIVK